MGFAFICGAGGGSSSSQQVKVQNACREGDLARLAKHVQKKKGRVDLNTCLTPKGQNLLHLALQAGHDHIASYLLSLKIFDATQPTDQGQGWYPLHSAAYCGRTAVVQQLLQMHPTQAAVEATTTSPSRSTTTSTTTSTSTTRGGVTPFVLAVQQGHSAVVKLLQENKAAYDPQGKALLAASQQGAVSTVRALLVANTTTTTATTTTTRASSETAALFLAVQHGHLSVAHVLWHYNAAAARNADKQTLLHVAAMHGRTNVVAWLLQQQQQPSQHDNGSSTWNVNAVDKHDRTALYWACRQGHVTTLQKMLSMATANMITIDVLKGKSPAVGAVMGGHVAILQLLWQHEPLLFVAGRLSAKTCTRTLVHTAAQHGQLSVVQFLMQRQAGGSIRAADDRGFTPLHYAAAGNYATMVTWLLNKGADIHAKTLAGETALDLARYKHYNKAIRALTRHTPCSNATVVADQSTTTSVIDVDDDITPVYSDYVISEDHSFDPPDTPSLASRPPVLDPTEFSQADDGEESWMWQDGTLVTGTTSPTWLSNSQGGSFMPPSTAATKSPQYSPKSTMEMSQVDHVKTCGLDYVAKLEDGAYRDVAANASVTLAIKHKAKSKPSKTASRATTSGTTKSPKDKMKQTLDKSSSSKTPPAFPFATPVHTR